MLISTVLHDDDYHQSSLRIHVHVHIYDASTLSVIQQAHALLVSQTPPLSIPADDNLVHYTNLTDIQST